MDDAIRSRLLRVRKFFFLSSSAVSSYIDAKSDRNRERGKEKARQEKKTLHGAQLLWGEVLIIGRWTFSPSTFA